MRNGRVIVVGSTNTDLVVHCDKLPRAGETVLGGDLLTFAGGKGANQAVAAARAGARVVFVGAFGDDAFGQARRADLEREGIDCAACPIKRKVPSGVALIAIGEGDKGTKAENLIVVAPGANARLTPADVRKAMPGNLGESDVVLCSLEVPLESIAEAMRLVSRTGVGRGRAAVVLNTAPMPPKGLPGKLLRGSRFLTPNETEFAQIVGSGSDARKNAAKMLRKGKKGKAPSAFIITRGARGVDVCSAGGYTRSAVAAPGVRPVDTVGAGDCFNGALAAELSRTGSDLDNALRFAVAAAAISVTRPGAQSGMPKRREILRMLRTMR
jgi:ribokinase